jgi:hypothetical protein
MRGKNWLKLCWSAGVVLSVFLANGCAAYKFSSPLLPLRESEKGEPIFQSLVLGIDSPADKSQSYELEKLIEDLNKTRLFKAVQYTDRLVSADLILTSFSYQETNAYEACPLGFVGQLLMMGSAGLIPQICNSKNEVSFVLYSPKDVQRKQTVLFTYETHTILGWAALFYTPSSAWTAKPSNDERANLLKAVFVREATDIQTILR